MKFEEIQKLQNPDKKKKMSSTDSLLLSGKKSRKENGATDTARFQINMEKRRVLKQMQAS